MGPGLQFPKCPDSSPLNVDLGSYALPEWVSDFSYGGHASEGGWTSSPWVSGSVTALGAGTYVWVFKKHHNHDHGGKIARGRRVANTK